MLRGLEAADAQVLPSPGCCAFRFRFDLGFTVLVFVFLSQGSTREFQGTGCVSAAALIEVLKACGDMGHVSPDNAIQWLQQATSPAAAAPSDLVRVIDLCHSPPPPSPAAPA